LGAENALVNHLAEDRRSCGASFGGHRTVSFSARASDTWVIARGTGDVLDAYETL
jgi:hypothetical protein